VRVIDRPAGRKYNVRGGINERVTDRMTFALPDAVTELVAILLLAFIVGLVAARFRQPTIIAFVATGVLVGPSGLGWVRAAEEIHILSEIGLAILLFVVGLKLDLHLVRSVGSVAAIVGITQVVLTAVGGFAISLLLGQNTITSVYLGLAVAFSSTVIVVKMLSDKRDIGSLYGRIALGILIVQDIMVVLALALLPTLTGAGAHTPVLLLLGVLAKGLAVVTGTALLGLFALPWLIDKLARRPELLLLFATSWALAVATAAGMLGFSSEVGAFLAGVALASTPHRDVLGARLVSLRDFLLLFFFLDLGYRLDLQALSATAVSSLPLSAFVLIFKPALVVGMLGLLGYSRRTSLLTGFTLGQVSEFSLILAASGVDADLIDGSALGLVTLIAIATIGVSASLINSLQALYERIAPHLTWLQRRSPGRERREDAGELKSPEVVVIGLGRYGRVIARELAASGRSVFGMDFDPQAVRASNMAGQPAVFGDAEDPEYLSSFPLAQTRWVVCSIRDTNVARTLSNGLRLAGYRGLLALTAEDEQQAEEFAEVRPDLVFLPFEDSAIQAADTITAREQEIERIAMDKKIEEIRDHYIICGFGRMGQQIAKDLMKSNVPFVVVETNPEQLPKLVEQRILHVQGKASEDETLLKAGIARAKGLISVLPTDEDNVFVVLTARGLNPGLFIVARSILEENEDKLKRAGADRVMSPYVLGGRQMAAAVVHPEVMDFLELVLHSDQFDTTVAHTTVSETSQCVGRPLDEIGIWRDCGVTVLAVRRHGEIHANPCATYVLEPGDEVIYMGASDQIESARRLLEG